MAQEDVSHLIYYFLWRLLPPPPPNVVFSLVWAPTTYNPEDLLINV